MKHLVAGLVLLSAAACLMAAEVNKPMAARIQEFPNKNTLDAAIYRGSIVFNHYCILCHGIKADGNGRAARIYNPRPINLVTSDKNDEYMQLIIRRGGAALARSEFMPPWGDELTDEQISDLVFFLRSIREKKP